MKAINLGWHIDIEEVYSAIFSVTPSEAGEYLGISGPEFDSLSKCFDIYDIIKESFNANPECYYELFDLPTEVTLPDRFNTRLKTVTGKIENDVSCYLSKTYGHYCERFFLEEVRCQIAA